MLSWKDTEIAGITSYAYAVRPYKKVDGKKVLGGYQAKQLYPVLSGTPEDILCQEDLQGAENLLESAEKKQIAIRSTVRLERGHGKRSVQISGGSSSSFEDKTAKKGTTYYYAVRAGIKTSGGKVLCGGYAAKAAKR